MKKYVPTWRDNEVRALSDLAGGFFAREIVAQNEKWDAQHHIARHAWLGKLGLLCCSIPEEYGGGGGTFAHDLAVFDAQGYAGDLAFSISAHSGGGSNPYPEWFSSGERVTTAFEKNRAGGADFLGAAFPADPCATSLTVLVEEQARVGSASRP